MCPKRHLPVEKPLFHLYKNLVLRWQNSRLWLQTNQRMPKFTVVSVWHEPAEQAAQVAFLSVWIRYFCYHRWNRLTVNDCHNLLFHQGSQDSCKSLCTQTAFGEDKPLIRFDDDCERRRLIYIDEIQSGTSLPKWRRRTFINDLSSVKQPPVCCTEIYKSQF